MLLVWYQLQADNLHSSYPGPNSVLQAPSDMADSTPNTDAAGLLSPSPNASTASTLSKDSEKTSSETPPGVESFLTATGEKLRDMAESNGAAAPELSVAAPAPPPPPMTMGGGAGMPPPPPGMFKQKASMLRCTRCHVVMYSCLNQLQFFCNANTLRNMPYVSWYKNFNQQ